MIKRKLPPAESKRSSEITTLGDAISEMLNTFKIKQKFEESRLVARWEEITGRTIASRTSKIFIKDQKLFLAIDSAVLRHQLLMSKSKLLDLLNDGQEEKVVIEIKFI